MPVYVLISLKSQGDSQDNGKPLWSVLRSSFKVAVKSGPKFIVAILVEGQAGTDAEDSFFRIGQAVAVDFVLSKLLQGITADPKPEALQHFVRGRDVGVERLTRLDAAGVKTDVGTLVLRIPKIVQASAKVQLLGGEYRESVVGI